MPRRRGTSFTEYLPIDFYARTLNDALGERVEGAIHRRDSRVVGGNTERRCLLRYRDVRDVDRIGVLPNEELERQCERRKRNGVHQGRAGAGITEHDETRGSQVEANATCGFGLIDRYEDRTSSARNPFGQETSRLRE
jgi:hypothetical protein